METVKLNSTLPAGITIRSAELEDVDNIVYFVTQEVPTWPRSSYYVSSLIKHYPGCLQIAEDADKHVCGTAIGIPTTDDESYFSLFIVRDSLRSKGIGRLLMRNCVQFLGKRNIYLYATSDGFSIFLRRGFHVARGTLQQWRGRVSAEWVAREKGDVDGMEMEDMKRANIGDLVEYNSGIQGIKQEWLFKHFLSSDKNTVGKVVVMQKKIVGFGYVSYSPFCNPVLTLYADNLTTAKGLLISIYEQAHTRTSEKWDITVPRANEEALSLVQQMGHDFEEVWEVTPMYTAYEIFLAAYLCDTQRSVFPLLGFCTNN